MIRHTTFVPTSHALALAALLGVGALPAGAQPAATPPPSGGAPATPPLTPEAMDALMAPIALYPDALVVQILQCAGSPFQVRSVNEWLQANPDLRGSAAQDGAVEQGFDDAFVAIVLFPDVVKMMAEKADWTRQVGQAFQTDRTGVFDSIQRLRAKAQSLGNLATSDQQEVETVATESGQQVIVIQPANPQVVYVPTYDPQVIYVQQAPPPPPPSSGGASGGQVAAAGLIGFAAGVIVGAAADDIDCNFYYHSGGWGYHGAIICNDGWDDYYDHRRDMANDYYDHRQDMANDYYDYRRDMADQSGQNQSQRQDARLESQGQRQDAASANQTDRRATASQSQSQRQSARGERDTAAAANRGQVAPARTSEGGGAFSGYQRGETERASSSRGNRSASRGGRRR